VVTELHGNVSSNSSEISRVVIPIHGSSESIQLSVSKVSFASNGRRARDSVGSVLFCPVDTKFL
jgi:hypothetical protein